MNQQKGFSLVEVLASLLLVTTLALSLIQQQWQSRQLLNQLLLREQGSQFLDQIDESLLAHVKPLPLIPSPYHLEIKEQGQILCIQLGWFSKTGLITRKLIQG